MRLNHTLSGMMLNQEVIMISPATDLMEHLSNSIPLHLVILGTHSRKSMSFQYPEQTLMMYFRNLLAIVEFGQIVVPGQS